MRSAIVILFFAMSAPWSVHGFGECLGRKCGNRGYDRGRLLQQTNSTEEESPLRYGSIYIASINGQGLTANDTLAIYSAFDRLVIRIKVLSMKNTVAAMTANLTRDLAPTKGLLNIFFSGNITAITNGYTVNDTTETVTLNPNMESVASDAMECMSHLSAFDYCPLMQSNVISLKVGFIGYEDPLGTLNITSAAKIIRKATLRGLLGTTLEVQVGKPSALDAYFTRLPAAGRRKLYQWDGVVRTPDQCLKLGLKDQDFVKCTGGKAILNQDLARLYGSVIVANGHPGRGTGTFSGGYNAGK
jgi:hypothetical protein